MKIRSILLRGLMATNWAETYKNSHSQFEENKDLFFEKKLEIFII